MKSAEEGKKYLSASDPHALLTATCLLVSIHAGLDWSFRTKAVLSVVLDCSSKQKRVQLYGVDRVNGYIGTE